MITTEIIDDFKNLTLLRPSWDNLLIKSFSKSVFLTWEWVETWWHTYQSDFNLLVLVVKKDGVAFGIAPLIIRKGPSPRLEFFGQNKAYGEYLDFLVPAGEEAWVTPLLCKQIADLHQKGFWQSMNLAVMLENSPNQAIIRHSLNSMNLNTSLSQPRISPYVELPDRWEKYLEIKGKKLKKRIEYNERRVVKHGTLRVEYAGNDDEVDEYFDDLIQLHRHRWDTPTDEVFFQFHRQIAHRFFPLGRLLLARLKIGAQVVAVKYDFVFDDRVWGYQGGWLRDFAKLEIGSVLLCEIFKHCIDRKLKFYDFLEGDDWYKKRWSTSELISHDLRCGKAGSPFIF